uniref:Peptide transporter PTR1 n=1 Tax=Aegilops tauschii TaxID=37682 RepID=N1QUX0_AEGTA
MPFVIGHETVEKLGSIGTAANLMMYLTSVFHMTNVHAAMALNAFSGTTNLATVGIGCIATLIEYCASQGMIILTLTAGVSTLHPPAHAGATRLQLAVLVLAFVFIVAGAGGIRPCNLAFGADQLDPRTDHGRRGIHSLFTLTIAVCVSSTAIIYVQSNVSWWVGFAIPAALLLVSCALFFAGARLYVRVRPEGSPLASVIRVAAAAFRNRHVAAPDDPGKSLFRTHHASELVSMLPYTGQFRSLDKAAVVVLKSEVDLDGLPKDPMATVQHAAAFAQTNTYVVVQAAQSDCHFRAGGGVEAPPGSFTIFPMLALTVWIPLYDRLVVPWMKRLTGRDEGITLLQRMGVGMVLSSVAMIVSGVVEQRRRVLAVLHAVAGGGSMSRSKVVSPQSAFWLVPLIVSEASNQVSQREFYYKEFPENMRSVAGSLFFTGLALSNYLSALLVSVVHRATGGSEEG